MLKEEAKILKLRLLLVLSHDKYDIRRGKQSPRYEGGMD